MDEAGFWRLIDVLQGQNEPADVERLVGELAVLSDLALEAFASALAKAVHDLDTEILFAQPITTDDFEPDDVDEDLFVSVRCAVVTAGRAAYERVLGDPSELSRRNDWPIADGEFILQAADSAYEQRTGKTWTFSPPWETETGDNAAGWPASDSPGPAADDSDAPPEWINVDYHFDDDEITELGEDPEWWVRMFTFGREVETRFSRDSSLAQRYADVGVKTVSVTVQFLEPTGKPPKRVKRRGAEAEIVLGRYLNADVAVSEGLKPWLETYIRDSLEMGLRRLAEKR